VNVTEANAAMTVLRWALGIPHALGKVPTSEQARHAAQTLAARSHKTLGAGLTADDVAAHWGRFDNWRAGDLLTALDRMADALGDSMTARDFGGHATCGEAQAIADVLHAGGFVEAAEVWIAGHGESDTGDDSHAGGA
jgi:hypothetical protein